MKKKQKQKIDTDTWPSNVDKKTPAYLRPRPDYWPDDVFASGYFSSIIPPLFTDMSEDMESRTSSWSKRWLVENERLLKAQRDEVSPVFAECVLGASIDAKEDMRRQDMAHAADRRLAAVINGSCDPEYEGTSKDHCNGFSCFRCSGQVVKLEDADSLRKSRFSSSSKATSKSADTNLQNNAQY